MPSLPTLVLLHGAWHTPSCWDTVITTLTSKGYKCLAPELLYCNTEKPIESMLPVITQVQDLIAAETTQGNDVVLINHSFGGFAGSSAVKGYTKKDPSSLSHEKSGHVLGLINVPAFMPASNTSLFDIMVPSNSNSDSNTDSTQHRRNSLANAEGWWELTRDPASLFYNDLSPSDAQKWTSQLVNFSADAPASREGVYAGWLDVPVWYLLCTLDNAMPIAQQEGIVQKCRDAGADITTRRIEAGHSPMLSQPGVLVGVVEDAVAAFGAVA